MPDWNFILLVVGTGLVGIGAVLRLIDSQHEKE